MSKDKEEQVLKLKRELSLMCIGGLAYTPEWNRKAKRLEELENEKEETFNPDEISLCSNCNCMTHTLYKDNICGKCRKSKLEDLKE